jgi:hypothetical protein
MLTLVPLLIDEPGVPQAARDLLVASRYAASREVARAARSKAGSILAQHYGLSRDDLEALLGFEANPARAA